MSEPIADRLSFAHSLFRREDIAGTPPKTQTVRIVVTHPDQLPTEYIQELERIINEKNQGKTPFIPGTRIVTNEQ